MQRQCLYPRQIVCFVSSMYYLCKGVAFCHGRGVLHRYLKPHNLLIDPKTPMLEIVDLGLARAFTVPLKIFTHEILTLWYRAPEVPLEVTLLDCCPHVWNCDKATTVSWRFNSFYGLHIFRIRKD